MTDKPLTAAPAQTQPFAQLMRENWASLLALVGLVLLPFLAAFFTGGTFSQVLANQAGSSKFIQGLVIEFMILAVYALSFDLLFGITGLLSFGHAMFFAVGAYLTGILLKSFSWGLPATLLAVVLAGVVQAALFAIVLPRIKGITFALVTLGLASVFYILIQTSELSHLTGGDVGLQGVISPAFISPASQRLRLYFLVLAFMIAVYLFYKRFINSPTGRVCIAIRENEDRARMLGYNTFYFKFIAMIVSSITAALAGALHTLYQPIVIPYIASMGYTVLALLVTLIGGVGTLTGAIVGAAVYQLMDFFLLRWVGEYASFVTGALYVVIVLFVPYGIVGTWRKMMFERKMRK